MCKLSGQARVSGAGFILWFLSWQSATMPLPAHMASIRAFASLADKYTLPHRPIKGASHRRSRQVDKQPLSHIVSRHNTCPRAGSSCNTGNNMRLGRSIVKKSHLYLSRIIHAITFYNYMIVACAEDTLNYRGSRSPRNRFRRYGACTFHPVTVKASDIPRPRYWYCRYIVRYTAASRRER